MEKSSKLDVVIPALPISNLGAVANMIKKCGGNPIVTNDPQKLFDCERIILAGVGSFDAGVQALHEGDWVESLNKVANGGNTPILGICLGMQLMCRKSEEGTLSGLSWFDADVKRIKSDRSSLKVPHMGWNTIKVKKNNKLLLENNEESRFYFVHTYHVVCDDQNDIIATTQYGDVITAAVSKNKIFGTQFHPEKSHRFGMQLIKSFLKV